jgi:GT2 family glycosyltransferase/glycosyltransferase involved in cell wall biosynthesis
MVTWGQAELALEALKALETRTPPCYEVILVDNGSPDGTGRRLAKEVGGATLVQLERNTGFGGGSNLGAMRARAPFLCFLNSDAVVQEGWLPPLLARLRSDPEIGAISPCILNQDGTLQEAGSHLKADGFTFAYGSGDDPDRPPYRFARDVDYASAVCLVVRRSAFLAVGGFDPIFHPAYFEDVDLCLDMGDRGLRTVYEPASRVVHVQHGSSSAQSARAQMERNREHLCRRWPRALRGRPAMIAPELHDGAAIACRDARAEDRVLLVDDRVPFRDRGSGDPRSAALVTELARLWPRARVTLLAVQPHEALRYDEPLWASGVEVVWGVADWERWLEERQFHYSVVIISRPQNHERLDAALRRTQPQALRVYDVEALCFRRLERQARVAKTASAAAALNAEAERFRRVELEAVASADVVWSVSHEEMAFVAGVAPQTETFRLVYPVAVETDPPGFAKRSGVLFFGGFLAGPGSPNEDSVLYLVSKIMPRLRSLDPGLTLTVVGADPTQDVLGVAGPGTKVVGYVPDPRPWLAAARLMLVPARFGAGIKLKLLDAMAAGLPFVTTPIGAEGLLLGDLQPLLVAEEPSELARRAWHLLSSPDLWAEVQERLLALAAAEFGPDAFRGSLVQAMAALGMAPPRTY